MLSNDRRVFQRLRLTRPILASLDKQNALILDLGVAGAFVEHYGVTTPNTRCRLQFRWQTENIEFVCEVARTGVVRRSGQNALSHTGVRFVEAIGPSQERLHDLMATFVGKMLAAQKANASGIHEEEGHLTLVDIGGARRVRVRGLVRYRLRPNGTWLRAATDDPTQPTDGFTVAAYEYESDLYESGVRRIRDYLVKLRDYVRASAHPGIRLAVLEWNLSRTYDWRAGLHAAGSLILYESLTPELTMTCPALLMRNTTDDPTWTAFIYHDHVSWFPGAGYVVAKLFREHFAETYLASTSGTFHDIGDRASFFSDISQMKPEGWQPGTVDAIATASADGRRLVGVCLRQEHHG